jgi:hypothetical protein
VSSADPLLHGRVVIQSQVYPFQHVVTYFTADTGVSSRPRTMCQESPVFSVDPIFCVIEDLIPFVMAAIGGLYKVYTSCFGTYKLPVSTTGMFHIIAIINLYSDASLCIQATAICLLIA